MAPEAKERITPARPTGVSVLTALVIIGGIIDLVAGGFSFVLASVYLSWLGILAGVGSYGLVLSLVSFGSLVAGALSFILAYGLWNGRTQGYRLGAFSTGQHYQLAHLLRDAKGKWLLTIGDHPIIRDLYKDFRIDVLTTKQCTEKVINGTRQDLDHLIIRNYTLEADKTRPTELGAFLAAEPVQAAQDTTESWGGLKPAHE